MAFAHPIPFLSHLKQHQHLPLPPSAKRMQETIALYAAPALHHMVSVVELGKRILHHHPRFTLTVLVAVMPATATAITSYIDRVSNETNLPISFFHLPPVHLPQSFQNQVDAACEFMRLNIPGVRDALQDISADYAVRALITSAFRVPHHFLNIPTYYYFTSCASVLSFFLQLPTIHNRTSKSFGELKDTLLHLPGLPTVRAPLLPEPLLDRHASTYRHFLDLARSLPKFHGLIVNTFDLLEPDAVKAVADGVCVPDGMTPPLYCIGPLIADAKDRTTGNVASPDVSTVPVNGCLSWLDSQPSRSVVFLCFGSRGAFSSAQVKEIALGLERSEQRFLWVVRNPPPDTPTEPDLDRLLPQGFLERTRNKGLVIKSWAPQAAILKHESVGGFVTHCGWNSVLEAVSFGVPMVAWPLYAEQHMNSVVLVEEMKLAAPISESIWSYEKGKEVELIVSAEEVEKRVRQLIMEVNMRERSTEMKERSIAAWTEDGSSFLALSQMVGSWTQG